MSQTNLLKKQNNLEMDFNLIFDLDLNPNIKVKNNSVKFTNYNKCCLCRY